MHSSLPPVLAGLSLLAASPHPPAPPAVAPLTGSRLLGLSQAERATLTTSPGGCALSVLYDNFELRGPPPGKPAVPIQSRRMMLITSSPAALALTVRGFAAFAAGARTTIRVSAGGATTKLEPKSSGDFVVQHRFVSTGTATLVLISVASPEPDAGTLMSVDSVDTIVTPCKAPANP